jgi:hypothetical protein
MTFCTTHRWGGSCIKFPKYEKSIRSDGLFCCCKPWMIRLSPISALAAAISNTQFDTGGENSSWTRLDLHAQTAASIGNSTSTGAARSHTRFGAAEDHPKLDGAMPADPARAGNDRWSATSPAITCVQAAESTGRCRCHDCCRIRHAHEIQQPSGLMRGAGFHARKTAPI